MPNPGPPLPSIASDVHMTSQELPSSTSGQSSVSQSWVRDFDPVVELLQAQLDSGQLSHKHIFYNLISNCLHFAVDSGNRGGSFKWDGTVRDFVDSLYHHGGARVVTLMRGLGFESKTAPFDWQRFNFPLPSLRSIRAHRDGIVVKSGIVVQHLRACIAMMCDPVNGAAALADTKSLKLVPISLQRDGMQLSAGGCFDPATKTIVGTTTSIDAAFIRQHPAPPPNFLKNNLVREADEYVAVSLDNKQSFQLGTDFTAACSGSQVRDLILRASRLLQTCACCLKSANAVDNVLVDPCQCTSECKGRLQCCWLFSTFLHDSQIVRCRKICARGAKRSA